MATIDLSHAAEYPIVLGDSLKHENKSCLVSVKYNWAPKTGLGSKSGNITGDAENLKMVLGDEGDRYSYAGWLNETSEDNSQIVLVYDSERSIYVLERLTACLNMNIKSADRLPNDQIRRYSPLSRPREAHDIGTEELNGADLDTLDESSPEASNPFDYRHFIDEARETMDKPATQGAGSPLVGARTPMSGFSSPLPGNNFHGEANPLDDGLTIVSSTNKKLDDKPWRRQAASKTKSRTQARQPATSARPAISSKTGPKSAARVVDSDSDSSDSDNSRAAPTKQPYHNRHVSGSSAAKSPEIIVTDGDMSDDSDDSGPPAKARGAAVREERPVSTSSDADVEMNDADDAVETSNPYLIDADDDDDEMGANDDFVFEDEPVTKSPSPPPPPPKARTPTPPPVMKSSTKPAALKAQKRKNSTNKKRKATAASPPPPQRSNSTNDYDEDAFAASLEAEFEAIEDEPDENPDSDFLSRNAIARTDPGVEESEESEEE